MAIQEKPFHVYNLENSQVLKLFYLKGNFYGEMHSTKSKCILTATQLKNLPTKQLSGLPPTSMSELCKNFQVIISPDKKSIEFKEYEKTAQKITYTKSYMQLFLKDLTGHTLTFEVGRQDTVKMFKEQCQEKTGMQPSEMRLLFSGKQLEDQKLLSDYKITDECTIHMVLRLRAGGPSTIKNFNTLEHVVKWGLTYEGPTYQTVTDGLNLQAKCHRDTCTAFRNNHDVYIKVGLGEKFLSEQMSIAKCPSCQEELLEENIQNFGFYNCRYKIVGKILKINDVPVDADKKHVNKDWEIAENDKYTTFNPDDKGAEWGYIKISTEPRREGDQEDEDSFP